VSLIGSGAQASARANGLAASFTATEAVQPGIHSP